MVTKILADDLFRIFNTSIVSALIGAFITIIGVWFTIRHDRTMRKIERRDTISPALSIKFIGITEDIAAEGKEEFKNISSNVYTFSFSPILETFSSYGMVPVSGYFPEIGRITNSFITTGLLFGIHVDGSYPVTNIKASKIKVTERSDVNYVQSDSVASIGVSLELSDSMFDFYHKHKPANFERLEGIGIPFPVMDINMYNTYISPNETMFIEVPMRAGVSMLSNLIKLVKNDKEFAKKEHKLDMDYPFDDPKALHLFLTNLNSFPIQITITFEYFDIDNNTYSRNVSCFAYLRIQKTDDGNDFWIIPSITTSGYIIDSIDEDELEEFINEKFTN